MDVKKRFVEGLDTIKTLTGLSQADFVILKEVAPQARQWCDEIIQVFYDTLFEHPRTATVFHQGERREREKDLKQWYLSLFEVEDETEFLYAQARIGLVHIRRHVHNQFMIGITTQLRAVFQTKAIEAFGQTRGLEAAQAFDRIINAVVGLTAEGYDVFSDMAFMESTGASPALLDRLIQQSVNEIEKELLGLT